MDKKVTLPGLRDLKRAGKKLRMVTAYDFAQAGVVDRSEVELILVGDSLGNAVLGYADTVPVTLEEMLHHTRAVVRGAARTPVVADLPFLSYQVSTAEAVRNAGLLMKAGAAGVKLEGGTPFLETVARLTAVGIPVMGHLGLTPQRVHEFGGYKVQGKAAAQAEAILDDALALERAGIFALVLECVPAPVARIITEQLAVPTIGIGAGPHCDGQVLVLHDLLGLTQGMRPKFVKRYLEGADLAAKALADYCREVAEGIFPGPEHSFTMPEEQERLLRDVLDGRR
ncbi:MAG: 3-methyl-2-oxobutanoate hydroxymethyltransferase [Thermaerobacter sp.]|nr:3-methyl-2-oxobutanoate hydroxymethyltransferase [Thermaerobacter sp.]